MMSKTTPAWSPLMLSITPCPQLFDILKQVSNTTLQVVEIPQADPVLVKEVKQAFPKLIFGVANIINTQQLEDAYLAGADFASSPGFLPEIVKTALIYSLHYIPGVATLSEAMQAYALGCEHVRPQPVSMTLCQALHRHLPQLKLYPAYASAQEAEKLCQLAGVVSVSLLSEELASSGFMSCGI